MTDAFEVCNRLFDNGRWIFLPVFHPHLSTSSLILSRTFAMSSRNLFRNLLRTQPVVDRSQFQVPSLRPYSTARSSVNSRLHYATALAASFATGALVTHQLSGQSREIFNVKGNEEDAAHEALLQSERDSHKLVKKLREDPEWKEVDPYSYLSGGRLQRNFTAGTLRGKGKVCHPTGRKDKQRCTQDTIFLEFANLNAISLQFALRPALFHNKDMTECIAVLHVGERLCGHDKIVHGGVLATLMDEMNARVAIPSLPYQTGFTANLNINYRKPVEVNQFIVMKSRLSKVNGRKAWSEAKIVSIDGETTFTESTALFVSPKDALLAIASRFRPA